MLLKRLVPFTFFGILTSLANAQWEVEVDPFTYAMDGFSAHLGYQPIGSSTRAQLGIYGADIPEWVHGDDKFDVRARGVTLKGDYFLFDRDSEWFIGVDANYFRMRYRLEETGGTSSRNQYGLGPRLGYKFDIGQNLYITPWISALYVFNADDVIIDGSRFSEDRYTVLPTVHIGWRF